MLDDLKYIHQKDTDDALGIAEKQYQQLEHKFEIPKIDFTVENIVYAGMGGSALAGRLSCVWPGHKVPFKVVSNYDIPAYTNEKTLFIACSYSGNTEETLSALGQAEQANAKIVVITGGGKLAEIAESNNYYFVRLPKASQPRFAVFYNLKALVGILVSAGLLQTKEAEHEMSAAANFLKDAAGKWLPTVGSGENLAKRIALDSVGRSMVIYSGPLMYPVAYKWKISFNENAKNVAWTGQYPEFNHNEFIGWSSHPVEKPYTVIDLRSSLEHARIQKRFELSEKLLSGKRPAPIIVNIEGKTVLEQLLWAVTLGDFVTIYTALLNGVNPTPVELIEKLKAELK